MTDPEDVLRALDPEQREVATTFGVPVVVIAGAGSGKTRALTHRIAYAALTGVLDPRRTLAVTFTTRAAGEMRARLHDLGVGRVQARTFHSAALRQNQYFWQRAYGVEFPQVTENRMGLVAEAASRQRLKTDTAMLRDLLSEVSWAKVSNVSVGDYPRLARQQRREVNNVEPEVVARVMAGYEQAKTARGQVDFDDILLCNAALLAQHPDVADEVRRTYAHFLVDEFQDVSPLQHTVLTQWLGERHDLCVVGDPNQSIHAFAGARASHLTQFRREHPDARLVRLMRNYRSTPQVVALANKVIAPVNAGVTLRAESRPGAEVEFAAASDEATEAAQVADWLSARFAEGSSWREMAVLFRIGAQSPALEAALSERGIPYQVRGSERFYERAEIRRALGVLREAVRQTSDADADPVELVREALTGAGWSAEPPSGSGRVREQWESLAALVDAVESIADDDADLDFTGVVDVLHHRASLDQAPTGGGVTLSTMHASKGLEWDAVALFGVHDGSVPFILATSPDEIAEERRLLHVAVTRARQHLRVSWSSSHGRAVRGPSRFLTDSVPAALAASAPVRTPKSRRASGPVVCRVCHEPVSTAAARKLGRHVDCPSSYDEALLDALKQWRKEVADEASVPAYVVFTDATLIALAETLPSDDRGLLTVPGIGATKVERYGTDVLRLLEVVRDRQNS